MIRTRTFENLFLSFENDIEALDAFEIVKELTVASKFDRTLHHPSKKVADHNRSSRGARYSTGNNPCAPNSEFCLWHMQFYSWFSHNERCTKGGEIERVHATTSFTNVHQSPPSRHHFKSSGIPPLGRTSTTDTCLSTVRIDLAFRGSRFS